MDTTAPIARGEALDEIRRKNLDRLKDRFSYAEIGRRCGVSAAMLRQIAARVVQQGGKSPRRLSSAYCERIERGLGLEPGWMDRPHDVVEAEGARPVPEQTPLTAEIDPLVLHEAVLELERQHGRDWACGLSAADITRAIGRYYERARTKS